MRIPSDPDRETLSAITRGDRQALAVLYDRHARSLLRYLERLVLDAPLAEDLLQDLFLIVWRDAGRYRGEASVRSWLYGIAHNLGLMALRKRREWPLEEWAAEHVAADMEADPADLAALAWDRERLSRALGALSAEHRAVVELVFYHGFKRKEAAQALGCPVGTVKSRLHYALRALARIMGADRNPREL